MPKADNEKRNATQQEKVLAHRVAEARAERKRWSEVEEVYADELKTSIGVDTTIIDADTGREVAAFTESAPTESFDYKRFFEDHPDQHRILQEDYSKGMSTRSTLTTTWVENDPPEDV